MQASLPVKTNNILMKTLFTLVLMVTIFAGCKNREDTIVLNSTYSGEFISGTPGSTETSASQVTFNQNKYTSTKGSGTYQIKTQQIISFNDENFWTANFDWNTILKGDYAYEIKGDSLIMTKKIEAAIYQYRLKLQK